jgi:hypothetical protein
MAPPAKTRSSVACALVIGCIATATPASINKATLYLVFTAYLPDFGYVHASPQAMLDVSAN